MSGDQIFNGPVGQVASGDIIHEAPKGPQIQIGEIKGGNNIIGQSGDIRAPRITRDFQ